VGTQHNVVVINGKRYDARTGKLLEAVHQESKTTQPHKTPQPKMMDGFMRPTKPHAARPVHAAAKVHAKTERSKTLMRTAVHKPQTHKVHAAAHAVHAPKTEQPVMTFHPDPVTQKRLARAADVPKSGLISKFGASTGPAVQAQTGILAVKPEPSSPPPKAETTVARHHQVAQNNNPFQSAIERSQAHALPPVAKTKRRHRIAKKLHLSPRATSMASLAMASLVLGGFITYQNIPNLSVRVAAARAGVRAQLPGYQPAGFSMDRPIAYSPGQITLQYHSRTDERAFQLTQRNSEWNSETLLENFVATNRRPYQTYQDKGKTIYIYDGSNATWVDSGVWYQIEGSSALNSDQLIRIANSL
jgi:hypothetical protein